MKISISTPGGTAIRISSLNSEIDFASQNTKVECQFNNQKEKMEFDTTEYIRERNQSDTSVFQIEIPNGVERAEIILTPIAEYDADKLIVAVVPVKISYPF